MNAVKFVIWFYLGLWNESFLPLLPREYFFAVVNGFMLFGVPSNHFTVGKISLRVI
jgi:uncharacterized membrane protein YiaA